MKLNIRRAGSGDEDHLALTGSATFLETFAGLLDGKAIVAHCQRGHSSAVYANFLSKGAAAWLVETEIGAGPVGFSLLDVPNLPGGKNDGSDVELKRIYLLSKFQGAGTGGILMKLALQEARCRHAQRLLLGVYAGNDRARRFYAKNGFLQIADRRFRVGDQDYDDVVLARPTS
jgi:diamine N-acetyltransferase